MHETMVFTGRVRSGICQMEDEFDLMAPESHAACLGIVIRATQQPAKHRRLPPENLLFLESADAPYLKATHETPTGPPSDTRVAP